MSVAFTPKGMTRIGPPIDDDKMVGVDSDVIANCDAGVLKVAMFEHAQFAGHLSHGCDEECAPDIATAYVEVVRRSS